MQCAKLYFTCFYGNICDGSMKAFVDEGDGKMIFRMHE